MCEMNEIRKRHKKHNSDSRIPMHSKAWNDGDWRALAGAMGLPLPGPRESCPRLFPMSVAPSKEVENGRHSGGMARPSMPVAVAVTTSRPQPPPPVAGLAAAKAAWASQRRPTLTSHRSSSAPHSSETQQQGQPQQQKQQAVAPPPPLPQAPPTTTDAQQRRLASCPLCGASLPSADPHAASAHIQACAASAMEDDW